MTNTKTPNHQRARTALLIVAYVSVGILAAVLIWGIIGIYSLVHTIRENQKINTSTNGAILSCTDPEGACYEQGQKRTADAVNNIGQLSVYASACAAGVDPSLPVHKRVDEIERCVRKLVEEQTTTQGASP